MTIEYYPLTAKDEGFSRIEKFVRKELRKRKDLAILVQEFLKRVKKSSTLQAFKDVEEIADLEFATTCNGRDKVRLQEMRIPIQRKGGVVRIYFIESRYSKNKLLLIDGEIKHKKSSNIKDNVKSLIFSLDY
nr:hypothetical protein [uncultured Sphaerochaeta sp.]